MGAIEVGRVCIKTTGREAGQKAVVVKVIDKNFVLIDGKRVKRRKCNVLHLFPTTEEKLKIKENEPHEEIVKMFK
mgnify:CR=1 FL=1